MKKSLVLAMAMALGVTASAYAANPFSDVPAGHWAYDSIDKLAAAGVIDGMGDGTYQGDKTMTRYEMAQIVAKAMAKGANVDKLAAEFAEELDNLGVRVAKLEKKADNVMISGEFRAAYKKMKADINGTNNESNLRSRLFITGKINEDWTYNAMLQNQQDLDINGKGKGEEGTEFKRAYVEGKLGGVIVKAGRQPWGFANGYTLDDDMNHDAVVLSYGSKLSVEATIGQLADDPVSSKKFYAAKLNWEPTDNFGMKAEFIKIKDLDYLIAGVDRKIGALSATYTMGDFTVDGTYIRARRGGTMGNNGGILGLSYKGAEADKVGSYGLNAKYYHQDKLTYIENANCIDGTTIWGTGKDFGFKGWSIGADCTLAKNVVAEVTYYDTKSVTNYGGNRAKDKVIWSAVTFNF